MQKWRRLGILFGENKFNEYNFAYAAVPVAEFISENTLRVFFSYRNRENKSLPGYLLFDLTKWELIDIVLKPVLELGKPGFFDEDGIMPCELIKVENKKLLYYIGWNKAASVPFRNALGLAISHEKNDFIKISNGPVLDRSIHDPCFVASACVIKEKDLFRMWYLSCVEWMDAGGAEIHKYHIKYAESTDGINWLRNGKIAIDFRYKNEYAISVPRVIKDKELYKMWYSFRAGPQQQNYQIGYAESIEGLNWTRKDEDIIFKGNSSAWDSDMICYPFIFDYNKERYMLYNGNGFGKTGIGIAILEK